jgi:glycosyltransferase involved in cell wall biosynthesis
MSKHKLKVSVVICAFNEEKFIAKTLESVIKQSYKNYEIIVVDNNSKDKTALIASKYTLKVIKEQKQGLSFARNAGFNQADGDILVKLDSDTVLEKNTLTDIVKAFDSDEKTSALTVMQFFGKNNVLNYFFSYLYLPPVLFIECLAMGHIGLSGPFYAIRSSVWKQVHPHNNDKNLHEDMDLSCHAVSYGKVRWLWKTSVIMSGRRFVEDPFHIFLYLKKGIKTYLLHHPSHKLHKVN